MHGGDDDDTEDNVESPPSDQYEGNIDPSPPANHPVAGTALVAAASAVAVPEGAAPAVSGTNSTNRSTTRSSGSSNNRLRTNLSRFSDYPMVEAPNGTGVTEDGTIVPSVRNVSAVNPRNRRLVVRLPDGEQAVGVNVAVGRIPRWILDVPDDGELVVVNERRIQAYVGPNLRAGTAITLPQQVIDSALIGIQLHLESILLETLRSYDAPYEDVPTTVDEIPAHVDRKFVPGTPVFEAMVAHGVTRKLIVLTTEIIFHVKDVAARKKIVHEPAWNIKKYRPLFAALIAKAIYVVLNGIEDDGQDPCHVREEDGGNSNPGMTLRRWAKRNPRKWNEFGKPIMAYFIKTFNTNDDKGIPILSRQVVYSKNVYWTMAKKIWDWQRYGIISNYYCMFHPNPDMEIVQKGLNLQYAVAVMSLCPNSITHIEGAFFLSMVCTLEEEFTYAIAQRIVADIASRSEGTNNFPPPSLDTTRDRHQEDNLFEEVPPELGTQNEDEVVAQAEGAVVPVPGEAEGAVVPAQVPAEEALPAGRGAAGRVAAGDVVPAQVPAEEALPAEEVEEAGGRGRGGRGRGGRGRGGRGGGRGRGRGASDVEPPDETTLEPVGNLEEICLFTDYGLGEWRYPFGATPRGAERLPLALTAFLSRVVIEKKKKR